MSSCVSQSRSGGQFTDGSYFGNLKINFNDPNNTSREGLPAITSLFNATQEDINDQIGYIGLPEAIESAVSYQFNVPTTGLSGAFNFFFKTWVYATVDGVVPNLTCDYTILGAASDTILKNISGSTTGSASLNIPITNLNANDYVQATLLPGTGITVQPGDQVHVKVKRVAGSSYAGTIGLMNTIYLLEK